MDISLPFFHPWPMFLPWYDLPIPLVFLRSANGFHIPVVTEHLGNIFYAWWRIGGDRGSRYGLACEE